MVNAAVLKKCIDFTDMRGFGYDGIQPSDVRRHVNNLLAGDPTECLDMAEGCWMPVHPLMIALQKKLSLAFSQYASMMQQMVVKCCVERFAR